MLKKTLYTVKHSLCALFLASNLSAQQETLTLTFDDGYACHYETVLPLLEKYGISATFYVTTGFLGQPGYLTADQVIELFQKGHEIGSHGVTHRNLKKLSPSEIEKELRESQLLLENLLQVPILHFAPPFGAVHAHAMHFIEHYYQSSRTIAPGLNGRILNPYLIQAYVVLHSTSLEQVEKWIVQAKTENKWIVLIYHHVDETKGIVSISPEVFESHLKAMNNIATSTLGEVLKL